VYYRGGIVNPDRRKSSDGILAEFIFILTLKKKGNAFSGQLQVAMPLAIQQYFMLQ
jgi:hypothetical protein